MQCSVHAPSPFIQHYSHQLLPAWSMPILSVLIVLQRCQFALLDRTPETQYGKDQLRQQFIEFGSRVATTLQAMGHQVDLFDPRTGYPLLSDPGQLQLDDVAVVRAILGYSTACSDGCSIALHPVWGTAVYPSVLVSSANPHVLAQAVQSTSAKYQASQLRQSLLSN